ncbi:restriction endonuclease subunit S [Acinetobacter sp. TGL-Y2]|uniref:restriction endonuclease subunit S n=1 Tax=Acinetobacter sp. TGL-Y2 TaxID=1407071 RepID=UPI000A6BAFB9|nr:restriction endonuclease subunit S [Acinetobacter sp. TGL-Y2]
MKSNDWKRIKISELCDLIVDCVNKTAPNVDYETPYKMIRTPNIKNGRVNLSGCRYVEEATFEAWTKRAKVKKNDVLLTREAPLGEAGIVDFKDTVFLGQRIMQYRPNPQKLDSNFLLYSFLSPDLQAQFRRYDSSGSIVSHIRVPDCLNFEIPTPSLTLQKSIARVLRALDEKIDINNKILNKYEDIEGLLFDRWFLQYDFPNINGKPYKNNCGVMVYNEILAKDVPEGWKISNLVSLIESTKTGDWGKDTQQDKYNLGVNCIRGADINGLNGKGKVETPLRFINSKNKNKILKPFDIIIEISGGSPIQSTGRLTSLIDESFKRFSNPLICSNFCKAISLVDNSYFYYFIGLWNKLYKHNVFFGWEGKTSGIKNFLFDAFIGKYYVAIPPKVVVQEFYKKIHPLNRSKQNIMLQNRNLQSLRDWLLPMLMNGQISIRDAEEQIAKIFEQ